MCSTGKRRRTAARRRSGSWVCVYLTGPRGRAAPKRSKRPIPTRPTPAPTTGSSTRGGPRASMYSAFYAQVCGTYRAGFEPIRDLLSHASLPPPLFVAANHHTPNNHASGSLPLSPSQSDGSVSSAPSYSPTHSHNSHAGEVVRRGGSHLSTPSTGSSASTGIGTSNSSAGGGGGGATQRLKR
ncbi:hypothetical protein B0H17DRAFT_449329 [Mycena rosella]|uniref:Uncharacterized protein n=1 Tax=Mycena rosella TaxID=1033263 RepID=A0AAD7CD38_MYCRO|nr:hypothetical protein B0H17DRAFT_449329 [Mycena rosella]